MPGRVDRSNTDRRQKGRSGRSRVMGRWWERRSELGPGIGGMDPTDCVGPRGLLGGVGLFL